MNQIPAVQRWSAARQCFRGIYISNFEVELRWRLIAFRCECTSLKAYGILWRSEFETFTIFIWLAKYLCNSFCVTFVCKAKMYLFYGREKSIVLFETKRSSLMLCYYNMLLIILHSNNNRSIISTLVDKENNRILIAGLM